MSVQLSVVLATARTLLNDDAATNWTDASLIPKAQQAHKELQIKLRRAAAPVMKNQFVATVTAGATGFTTPPTDLVAPISLFETTVGGAANTYAPMTEADPLPNVIAVTTLIYWQWFQETILFIGATANRQVLMNYWRALNIPQLNTDLIGFLNGELYMAPRTAALAAASVGQADEMARYAAMADASLSEVILSNRGRAPQAPGSSLKP